MYFIKKRDCIMGEVIFIGYYQTNINPPFVKFAYTYMSGYSYLRVKDISIYRYVSQEEYWAKVKQKYDTTCLDIVLKRLVDESFEW
jgi:hypothetical protein